MPAGPVLIPGGRMASEFETLFAATGLPALVAMHGDAAGRVTVTAAGGVAAVVPAAMIGDEMVDTAAEGSGQVVIYKRDVTFETARLPALRQNAKVTVDGVQYSIHAVLAGGVNTITATLIRTAAGEVTRPDYRATRGA